MADDESTQGNEPDETPAEEPVTEQPAAEEPVAEEPGAEEPAAEEPVAEEEPAAEEPVAEEPAAEEPAAEEPVAEEPPAEEPAAETPPAAEEPAAAQAPAAEEVVVEGDEILTDEDLEDEEEPTPRVKPEIPGAELEPDIVREGEEALRAEEEGYEDGEFPSEDSDEILPQPITDAAIDLAAGARYRATGKRKTAVARVILLPGNGAYTINGRTLEAYFPRPGLQRQIRNALETVGLEAKMDVVAKMHGGGVSAQAGALRHGISRALVDADPNLRGELKRRGFLTRDSRVKERKKAGLKKARKRPQFSKR
jgi:small subunit ribosomal protein S9